MSYDIYFAPCDPDVQRESGALFGFKFQSAVGVQGIRKLLCKFWKIMLTTKGSDPLNLQYGSGAADLIGSNIGSVEDATDALALAIDDASDQLHMMDQQNFPPDDERLQAATLTRIDILDPDGFRAYVTISNVAGSSITAALPLVGALR